MRLSRVRWVGIGILAAAVAGFAALTPVAGGEHEVHAQAKGEHPTPSVSDLTVTASTLGATLAQQTEEIPDPPAGKVAIRLSFRYFPDPLPGEGVTVWWPQPEAAGLWNECHCEPGVELPRDQPVQDRTIFVTPDGEEEVLVMLVVENPTTEKLEFQALIPQSEPSDLETRAQVWPTCFCVAAVHWAPPAQDIDNDGNLEPGAWYRVIRLRAGPKLEPGTKVDLIWTVVTDPAEFVRPGG